MTYPDQKRSTIALASILRQLFMAQPHLLSNSVLDQFDTEGEKLVESFRGLWDILMSITASSNSGEIICVMDALDECQEDDRNQLIGAVRDLYLRSNNNSKLRFFLTSRPYGYIRREFRELENQMPTIHLSGEGQAEVEKISHEINLVIMKRVQDIRIKKIWSNRSKISCKKSSQKYPIEPISGSVLPWITFRVSTASPKGKFAKQCMIRSLTQLIKLMTKY